MGGWGRRTLNVTPSGKVLPCHAAETIPGLEFWSVARAFARRGLVRLARLQRLPGNGLDARAVPDLRSRSERDWGGCRCQALALLGDASATDPACSLSPFHHRMEALAAAEAEGATPHPTPTA